MTKHFPITCFLTVTVLSYLQIVTSADEPAPSDSTIWEEAIRKFEAEDHESPPPQDGILFIGGSNIRRWNLEDNFSDLPVINRGFGGSMIADAVFYADRIVIPYRPKTIVLYGGANDMGKRGQKTPQQVLADYQSFVNLVHKQLPKTRILYISLPHFYRNRNDAESIGKVDLVNKLIAAAVKEDSRLTFVDVNKRMTDENGQPRSELFLDDGIHMSPSGYEVWSTELRPLLCTPKNH